MQIDNELDDGGKEQPMNFFETTEDEDNATANITSACDAAVTHALPAKLNNDTRYNDEVFYGVIGDTGCA